MGDDEVIFFDHILNQLDNNFCFAGVHNDVHDDGSQFFIDMFLLVVNLKNVFCIKLYYFPE